MATSGRNEMAVEDDQDIPEQAREALKKAEREAVERALDLGLAIAMRAQQKLSYHTIMMTAQPNRDVVASIVTLYGNDRLPYARVDWPKGQYQKI